MQRLSEALGQADVAKLARGRPKAASPKQAVNIRLDGDILAEFQKDGPGWQTRMNQALREWLEMRRIEHGNP